MKYCSILIRDGIYEKKINFEKDVNLIFSKKNSRGKTTLLRLMLYGMGYDIPSTRKLNFNKMYIEIKLFSERIGEFLLRRISRNMIEIEIDKEKESFVLPGQQHLLHELIYGTNNIDILSNLLGSFYVDQEKGWTLLNRGTVIGKIYFNIERFLRGLAGIDCIHLIREEEKLQKKLDKYKQMLSVAKYREMLQEKEDSLVTTSVEEIVDSELNQLIIQERILNKELRRIDRTLSDNKRMKKYIADMKLIIALEGEEVRVTEENVLGLTDSIELLITKRKQVSSQILDLQRKILKIETMKEKENEQLSFFSTATQLQIFDKQILKIPLNAKSISKQIDNISKEKKKITEEIKKITKESNFFVKFITDIVEKYAEELEIGDIFNGEIFTSDLKSLSGAVLHKMAFVFRLGYISAIEEKFGIKLPIILDSPSGKEVDRVNVTLMMNILKRDFPDNQIIIASIFEYDFDKINKIELIDGLFDYEIIKE